MYGDYQDDDKLSNQDNDFIHEIFKHHYKYEELSTNLSHFTVGVHPTYTETRCFFLVKKDQTKQDFSIQKCITRMEQQGQDEPRID
jgi:DNA-directed RNA polymerase V subunit 1